MERTQAISIAYKPYKDGPFADLTTNVLKGLTGNENYPRPTRDLDTVQQHLDVFIATSSAMRTGLKAATPQRDHAREVLEDDLRALSAYATAATPARPDLWAGANFPLTKATASPRPASQPITGLVLADGPSAGTLQASVDTQRGMYGYQWRIYPKDTTAAQLAKGFCYRTCTTRKAKAVFENLDSGVAYYIECAAWNDSGLLQWTAPVSRIVQ